MYAGFLFLLLTGLGWAFTGATLSYTARNNIRGVTLLAPQIFFSLVLAIVLLPDYSILMNESIARIWPLAVLLFVAGVINAAGIIILQTAMRSCHNGIAWAIGQSALVIPFIVGAIYFGEPFSVGRVLGVAGIVTSLAAFGTARTRSSETITGQAGARRGLLLAVAALFILGSAQSIMTLPSHLPGLVDTAKLRVPLLYLGSVCVYVIWWLRRPVNLQRGILILAAISSVVGIISSFMLFAGIDRLAQVQMAALGFPVAVGCCILTFSAYSAWGLREPFTIRHIIGLVAGFCGIIGIVLSG